MTVERVAVRGVAAHRAVCSAHPRLSGNRSGRDVLPWQSGYGVKARTGPLSVPLLPRIGHDANGRLRTALSMVTLSAARYNPAIMAFYRRLRAAGKPPKAARCAAARELPHQAWALGSKPQRFDPDQQHEASLALAA